MTLVRQSPSPASSRSGSPEPYIVLSPSESDDSRPASPDSFETAREQPCALTPVLTPVLTPDGSPALSRASSCISLRRIPSSPRLPAAPEDLSLCMRTVWMPDAMGVQRNFLADMAQLAKKYKYQLIVQVGAQTTVEHCRDTVQALSNLTDEELDAHVQFVEAGDAFTSWGEDNKILTLPDADGRPTILYPPRPHRGVFELAQAYVRDEAYHLYNTAFQGAVSQRNEGEDAHAFAMHVGIKSRCTASYLEGGNVLTGQLPDGKPYAVVGRDSLLISTFALRYDNANHHTAHRIAARRRALEEQEHFTETNLQDVIDKLIRARQAQSSWSQWVHGKKVTSDDAKNFCAEMDLTHDVIARDLGLPRAQVFFVPQPDFHIDMHMRPMFAGEVLLNDPRVSVRLLRGILKMEAVPWWQREELVEMLDDAERRAAQSSSTVDDIAVQLEAAGLRVRRVPGVMESENRHANFMNGIPGRTKDGDTFYFTNASSITWLQRAIMHYFHKVIGVDHIEFVGGAGGGEYSANAAEASLDQSGGLDCREVHSSAAFGLLDAA